MRPAADLPGGQSADVDLCHDGVRSVGGVPENITYPIRRQVGGQVSYEDYGVNSLQIALDLASLGDGSLGFPQLLERQRLMFTDHGYPAGMDAATEADRKSTRLNSSHL